MVWVPGGTFTMGSDDHYPEEGPTRRVEVDGVWMDRTPVTTAEFREFVEDTGYVTLAERDPDPADYPGADPEMLVPGSAVFVQPDRPVSLREPSNWWAYVPGANWRQPLGPDGDETDRSNHPVVHVAHEDAAAYAEWADKRLPTEAEHERASRGGLEAKEFAWGDEFMPDGNPMANTWQGTFPYENTEVDGYVRTSPVGAFPANGYGLEDIIGNVWEWTNDWFRARTGGETPACCAPKNPRGGTRAQSVDPRDPSRIPRKVLKGGSHLCAPNYCVRYRPAARYPEPIDTTTTHVGFRCVVSGATD
ncbi:MULTISPECIES: formylglycine-generating enzyme family protein [unclassified Haloferax]|uniref:formylglycine-generating enzyme family protein n=1 Tax=unclassified Haloferax TaxID=2625095 RepID=UPI00287BACC2|nr:MULTISPECIES: formylglycine-generating enzyme family protein [unclassified Haloferax]